MFKKIIAVIIAAALSVGMLSTSVVAASEKSKNISAASSGEWKNFGKALTSKEISSYEDLVSAIEYAVKMCAPTIKLKLSKNYQYGRDFDLNDISMISRCTGLVQATGIRNESVVFMTYEEGADFIYAYQTNDTSVISKESIDLYNKCVEIIDECTSINNTDLENEIAINNYLIDHIQYWFGCYNIRKALMEGKAACEGYTRSFLLLLRMIGIKSWKLSTGEHCWNCVKIDGKYYYTDVTWNDDGTEDIDYYKEKYPNDEFFYAEDGTLMRTINLGDGWSATTRVSVIKRNCYLNIGFKKMVETRDHKLPLSEKEYYKFYKY